MYNKMSQYDTTCSTVVPSVVKNLTVTALSAILLRISWEPPLSPNGVLTGYQVEVVNLITSTVVRFNKSQDDLQVEQSDGICKCNVHIHVSTMSTISMSSNYISANHSFSKAQNTTYPHPTLSDLLVECNLAHGVHCSSNNCCA